MDLDLAARLYREGQSLEKVAAQVGVSRETVRRQLPSAGVTLRTPRRRRPRRRYPDRERPRPWRQIFLDALAEQEVISVRAVVAGYLRRTPTRAELNAGRRAAHGLAADGEATVFRAKPAGTRTGSANLILTRPGAAVGGDLLVQIAGASQVEWPHPAAVEHDLVAAVEALAAAARAVRIEDLDPVATRRVTDAVDAALEVLERMRRDPQAL